MTVTDSVAHTATLHVTSMTALAHETATQGSRQMQLTPTRGSRQELSAPRRRHSLCAHSHAESAQE